MGGWVLGVEQVQLEQIELAWKACGLNEVLKRDLAQRKAIEKVSHCLIHSIAFHNELPLDFSKLGRVCSTQIEDSAKRVQTLITLIIIIISLP